VLPQGQAERASRVLSMAAQAREEGFGHCTTIGECAAVCPAGIQLEVIARMNRDWLRASLGRQAQAPVAIAPRSSPMRFYESEPAKR
jgi:succinate dehydrogenase / fumarate reductase iron-sulfur subunit